MKRVLRLLLCLGLLTMLVSGCVASSEPETQPTPTVPMEEYAAPSEAPKEAAAAEETETVIFKTVGEEAVITVGSVKIGAPAYYTDAGGTMVFPLAEVLKALGWSVTDPDAAGPVDMKLTREGAEEIVIRYTKPIASAKEQVEEVTVLKGGQTVNVAGEVLPFVDDMLYATESFIRKVIQDIEVSYDGKTNISIEAIV